VNLKGEKGYIGSVSLFLLLLVSITELHDLVISHVSRYSPRNQVIRLLGLNLIMVVKYIRHDS
jgi:lipopolysaccharide export LptBFGC system permease protein LptF